MSLKVIRNTWHEKSFRTKYAYAFVIILVIAAFLMNFVSLPGLLQGQLLIPDTIALPNIAFLFLFTFLAALAAALHFHRAEKYRTMAAGKEKLGIVGTFLGFFTSACTVCYPFILTALGVPAALAVLPFGGAELQAASIVLLLASIYFVSRSIEKCESCKIREKQI